MNRALQSYTPTVFVLEYDSLIARGGCETVGGNDVFNWLAFEELCVAEHSETSALFNQSDIVSYSFGPTAPGDATAPFVTGWAAWVGSDSVRIGKYGFIVPPANTLGEKSTLYLDETPPKITHAFNVEGLLVMAIESEENLIQLRRYTDDQGTIEEAEFTGFSPVLFFSGLLDVAQPYDSGVICFYLKADRPHQLFARFEQEDFGTEHTVMPDLRARPERLISAFTFGRRQYLAYIDTLGRDATLKSAVYAVKITDEQGSFEALFESGIIVESGVTTDTLNDKGTLAAAFSSGLVFATIKEPTTQPPEEAAMLSASFDNGEVF